MHGDKPRVEQLRPGQTHKRVFTLLACCALDNSCCQEHSRAKTMTNLPASVTAEVNRT